MSESRGPISFGIRTWSFRLWIARPDRPFDSSDSAGAIPKRNPPFLLISRRADRPVVSASRTLTFLIPAVMRLRDNFYEA
jgi:hypothetical protein